VSAGKLTRASELAIAERAAARNGGVIHLENTQGASGLLAIVLFANACAS